jgi:hypothetical protein
MQYATRIVALVVLLILLVSPGEAQAQAVIEIGPRAGYDVGGDVEELFIGAEGRIGLASLPVLINPAFDYYFAEENVTIFQFSANALYEFGVDNQAFTPYAGAGIGFTRFSIDTGLDDTFGFDTSTTETGINLIGGAKFETGNLQPFVQAQITFGDVDLFTVGGGLLFGIGGN